MLLFTKAKQKYLQNLNVTLHGTGGLQYHELKCGQLKIHCNRFFVQPKDNLILNSN